MFRQESTQRTDSGEALTAKSFASAREIYPRPPILSRPPLSTPPGRCALVKRAIIEWYATGAFYLGMYNISAQYVGTGLRTVREDNRERTVEDAGPYCLF